MFRYFFRYTSLSLRLPLTGSLSLSLISRCCCCCMPPPPSAGWQTRFHRYAINPTSEPIIISFALLGSLDPPPPPIGKKNILTKNLLIPCIRVRRIRVHFWTACTWWASITMYVYTYYVYRCISTIYRYDSPVVGRCCIINSTTSFHFTPY